MYLKVKYAVEAEIIELTIKNINLSFFSFALVSSITELELYTFPKNGLTKETVLGIIKRYL
tara:strand:+ start:14 stop:196 length:183 start_codon:yes stop_codon:yes gene_type:complete